jgi:hypothetical protein
MIRLFSSGVRLSILQGITAALTTAILCSTVPAHSQNPLLTPLDSAYPATKSKKHPGSPSGDKDAPQPSIVVPTAPLGFASPAPFYLGERFAQASLNFLDENTLLFTFRVPGLIAREPSAPGQPPSDERHIRALTLSLPSGKVAAESLWVLHDYTRYLWMLKGSKFLLRDRNELKMGDASLHLEPFLRFPGPVNTIEFDPRQDWLVADTTEPPAPNQQQDPDEGTDSALISSTAANMAANGHVEMDLPKSQRTSQDLLRIFDMRTRKFRLFSRVNQPVHLPIDGEGYYEALRGEGPQWMITFEYFQGASRPLGWIDSTCNPALDAIAPGIVLASGCMANGARHLVVLSRDRDKDHCRLWETALGPTKIWPQLVASADGLRLARATLEVSHPIGPYNPLGNEDIRGQSVQVYDLATGKVELTVPASPVLDAGGNFAMSPSGNRFAVLNQGAIQIFDLPPAPPVPLQPEAGSAPAKP